MTSPFDFEEEEELEEDDGEIDELFDEAAKEEYPEHPLSLFDLIKKKNEEIKKKLAKERLEASKGVIDSWNLRKK